MKNTWKLAPLFVLAFVMFGCGGGGGTPDPRDIGHAAFKQIVAKDFDSLDSLMDPWGGDVSLVGTQRAWQIEEGYRRWKDYKARLEGDNGMDPKSKSEIDGEEAWKNMSFGKAVGLEFGLYKLYAVDDLDKRLESPWTWNADQKLQIEGQGNATMEFENGYKDTITVTMSRREGLWYLTSVRVDFQKELPKKPKDE